MQTFLKWLSGSAGGSALKVAVGGALAYLLNNIAAFDLPPVAAGIIMSVVPPAINFLNPEDPRYGRGASEEASAE